MRNTLAVPPSPGVPTHLPVHPRADAPRALAEALVRRLPDLLDDVAEQLRGDWPDFAAFLDGQRGEIAGTAEAAMGDLARVAAAWSGAGEPEVPAGVEGTGPMGDGGLPELVATMFEEIGAVQCRQGRELSDLLSAYQAGVRVAWRHVAGTALELALPPTTLTALAEALFVFVDQLSSASANGYLVEQSESAYARERLREELGALLLSDRSSSERVRSVAARLRWRLPATLAVVLVDPDDPDAQGALGHLDASCLPVRGSGLLGAVVADPAGPGRRTWLLRALGSARSVVGPACALDQLPASVRTAAAALRLQCEGVLPGGGPLFVEEHLDALIVHRDRELLAALRQQGLAPLRDRTAASRERLEQTLASWLRQGGDRAGVAEELHVHPQTVRYRLGQLREVFGDAMDDPRWRMRLTLALAWGAPGPAGPPEGGIGSGAPDVPGSPDR